MTRAIYPRLGGFAAILCLALTGCMTVIGGTRSEYLERAVQADGAYTLTRVRHLHSPGVAGLAKGLQQGCDVTVLEDGSYEIHLGQSVDEEDMTRQADLFKEINKEWADAFREVVPQIVKELKRGVIPADVEESASGEV